MPMMNIIIAYTELALISFRLIHLRIWKCFNVLTPKEWIDKRHISRLIQINNYGGPMWRRTELPEDRNGCAEVAKMKTE